MSLSSRAALVGRERERKALRESLEHARDSRGGLVLVSGEAGIGKTALVDELSMFARDDGILVLTGGAYDISTTPPYCPWVEVLRDYPGGSGLPALPEQLQPGGGMAGIDSQEALFELAGRFLSGVAAVQPLLILLEDLHWADSASLDLLRYLSRSLVDDPVLLIATYRHNEITREHPLSPLMPALVREGRVHRLQIQRLDREAVLEIVRQQYRLSSDDEARLMDYLDRLAEGNPFFTNELLYTLEGQRLLSPAAGGWRLGDLSEAGVPSLVQQVIHGRLARIDAAARELLDIAAVVGYDVSLDLLRQLHDGPEAALDGALQQALDHHLIHMRARQRPARFSHALVRQTIYEALPPLRRQTLHQQVGDLLANRSRPDFSTVANHLYEAGDERALEWLARAAEQARALFAPQTVIGHAGRGIALATRLGIEEPLGLYRLRGQARESLGDFDGARSDHELVLERAPKRGDQHAEWQALLDLGSLWTSRNYKHAGTYYEQALERANQSSDATALANSHNVIGNWLANVERHIESERHHLQALEIFKELDDRHGVAATYNLLGLASLLGGHMVKSSRYYDDAIALFRDLNEQPALAQALGNLFLSCGGGPTYPLFIDPARRAEAAPAGDEARRIAGEIGWTAIEVYTINMVSQPLIARGDYQQALDASLHGLELAEAIAHSQWICYSRQNIGDLYHDLMMLERAQRYLEPSIQIADSVGSIVWRTWNRCSLALIYLDQGEIDRAGSILAELAEPGRREISCARLYQMFAEAALARAKGEPELALAVADRLIDSDPAGRGNEAPKTLLLRGETLIDLGRHDEAQETLQSAARCALALGYRPQLWRGQALLSSLYLAQGRVGDANEASEDALEIIDRLADQLDDQEMRAEFLRNARARVPRPTPYAPDRQNNAGLTPRELEVLRAVADGLTDAEAGERLFISARTASHHLRSIYNKLGVNNRAAAVRIAVEQGLV